MISPTTRKPGSYWELNTKAKKLGLPLATFKLVILATMASSATATAATPVQVYSEAEARTLFGSGSPAALMVSAVLTENPYVDELWVVPLAEAEGGAQADGTATVAVDGLTAGTLYFYIGTLSVTVNVTEDDDEETIATALCDAINADTSLPFVATVTDAVVTLQAVVAGTSGNAWVWASEFTGSGLTVALVQPSGGSGDADVQDALDSIVNAQFDLIAVEWRTSGQLDALVEHLDTVSGPLEQRPGVGVAAFVGSVGSAVTLGSGRNSGRLVLGYQRGTRMHPMMMAAALMGIVASEPDVARPLNGLPLKGGAAPDLLTDYLSRTEIESLLHNGVAPFEVSGGKVQLVRSVTTYVTDAFGAADDSLLDLQTIRTLDYIRYVLRTSMASELDRVKIADEAQAPNTTDPTKIRSLILGLMLRLEAAGYVERVETWKDDLTVERDEDVATRVNVSVPADIVDGLHVLGGTINLILG